MSWFDIGACRGEDPDLFFPARGEPLTRAKAICHRCPVRETCLEYALDHGILHGVWGGKSERERRRMRRFRPQKAPQIAPIRHGTKRGYLNHLKREGKGNVHCVSCLRASDLDTSIRKEHAR